MKSNARRIVVALLAGLLIAVRLAGLCFGESSSTAKLDLLPNYHTVGVNVVLEVDDAQKDAWASLAYGPATGPSRRGFPLSRVDNEFQRLSGCIFWCNPGTTYHVEVTIHDKTTAELDGTVLRGTVTTRREPVVARPSRTLYVSSTGKGAAFTRSNPGRLKDGLAHVRAGQRLLLLNGTYHVGNLKLARSGTVGKPIRIEGEKAGRVVIDGAQTQRMVWRKSPQRKGLYVTESQAINPNLVLVGGKRLYPHQTLQDLLDHKIAVGLDLKGKVRFDSDLDGFYRNPSQNPLVNNNWRSPRRLYVKLRDNSDPRDKRIIITGLRRGLTIAGQSHIRLKNLRFAHFGLAPAGTALDLRDCRDLVVDHCVFGINDIGISLAGDCSRITIQDSEFFDAMKGYFAWKIKASYDLHAPYSTAFPYLSRMLERGGLIYAHGFRGRGIVVRRCRFHDYAQAGHLGPASFNRQFPDSYEIDFHDNEVFNCAEDGLELDADARNVRVWNNVFHDCNASLSLAVARCGPTYIFRNVFHSIVPDIFTIRPEDGLKTQPGHPFKLQTGDTNSRVGDLFFFHNTVDADNEAVGLDLVTIARWKSIHVRNNLILTDKGQPLVVRSTKPFPLKLDYNGFFTTGSPQLGSIDRDSRDRKPASVLKRGEDFQKLNWQQHGFVADPQFRSASTHDYRLQPSSPAVDAGQLIPGINDHDFSGRSPDIGAIELRQ